MGGLLSIPKAFILSLSVLSKKGVIYWLQYIVPYIYLTLDEIFRKKRLDLCDFSVFGQPEKNGFFVPKEEKLLDEPIKSSSLEKHSDDAFLYGTNSKGEYLAVNVCRRPNENVQCSIFLHLSDGKIYCLPKEHTVQRASSEENTFGSSRLKLQCLIPMRKWRIFFNGILEESEANDDGNKEITYKHAKFSFIWTASSEIFDFSRDLSKNLISDAFVSSSLLKSPSHILRKLQTVLDGYEQPGMILGTIKMENDPEREIYLWGSRKRFMGENMLFREGTGIEIYANFKNGAQIHLCASNNCGPFKRFQYGYVMVPTGFIFPIDDMVGDIENLEEQGANIKCYADNASYDIRVSYTGNNIAFQKECGEDSTCRTIEITMNGKEGRGLIFRGIETKATEFQSGQSIYTSDVNSLTCAERESCTLCIPFKDKLCCKPELCGGKGSSLGNLYRMSLVKRANSSINFCVPNGLVVSTDAYKEFIKGKLSDALRKFEKDIWLQKGEIQSTCQKMVRMVGVAELPGNLVHSITEGLETVFGDSFSKCKFAVRSSATGEDTEQMSAAGQMETFLGLKTISEVLHAVKKCWASQFSFQAVEYKRGYGQPLNSPMAVVIQEMVSCEKAGVIFTCDPVTGNPSYISVTANWGLGESVVSASADPDMVMLERTLDNKLSIHDIQVGQKKSKIIMDGDSGTKETTVDDNESSKCCISETMALNLGNIAAEIENFYGTPRDIEWGIVGEEVFLFQSRPVTSLDIETDFETKHFFDAFQRTERSFLSKANTGEVMPGATSPLGIDLLHKVFDIAFHRRFIPFDEGAYPRKPYYQKSLPTAFNHLFVLVVGGFIKLDPDNEELKKSLLISIFGRFIDDKELCEESVDRNIPPMSFLQKMKTAIYMLGLSLFAGIEVRLRAKRIRATEIPFKKETSMGILHEIGNGYDITCEAATLHINASMASSTWNLAILQLLAKAKGDWDQDVFSDFAYLLSTCNAVESANIPCSIQDLGVKIHEEMDAEKFKKMTDEGIVKWLENNLSEAGTSYRQFLERHGHRCLKEVDVYSNTWKEDPQPVIAMLKNFVNENATASVAKEIESFQTIFSKLRVKLTFKERCKLRFLLPNAIRGVQGREYAKSLAVFTFDKIRKPLRRLAEIMVAEGRLPRKELLFFFCIDEIQQLIDTRSPRLIARATRRYKVQEELDKLIFPEICTGIPKPINDKEEIDTSGKGFKMTGVPVSQGIVKALVRVVMTLKEAPSIQQGEILITYSTDIGWSPYFPLLSGLVTELGGLISHGAVVAREYGLPCVVSLHGATRAFKSGDVVILDGNNGTIQKVDEE